MYANSVFNKHMAECFYFKLVDLPGPPEIKKIYGGKMMIYLYFQAIK